MLEPFPREGAALVFSAVVGSLGVFAQAISLPDSPLWERLGIAGLLVAGAYFMLRYFMSVVERKDAQLERMTSAHTAAMVEHLQRSYEVQQEMTGALHELRDAIKAGRR